MRANSLVNSLVLGSSGDLLDSEIEREPLEVLGINEKEAFSLFSKEIQEQYQGAIDIFL